jgi:hypothetical protein
VAEAQFDLAAMVSATVAKTEMIRLDFPQIQGVER